MKVHSWRNLDLLNGLMFWSLKGKCINQNISKSWAASRSHTVTVQFLVQPARKQCCRWDNLSSVTLCSYKMVCAAKTPLYSQSLTGLNQVFLLYVVNLLSKSENSLPVSVAFSSISIHSSKAGFTRPTCTIKKDLNNSSEFFSLPRCVGKLTMDKMQLQEKKHLLNFAIQSLLKSHCKTAEQHVGRLRRWITTSAPLPTELLSNMFPTSVSEAKHS